MLYIEAYDEVEGYGKLTHKQAHIKLLWTKKKFNFKSMVYKNIHSFYTFLKTIHFKKKKCFLKTLL